MDGFGGTNVDCLKLTKQCRNSNKEALRPTHVTFESASKYILI